MVNNTQMLLMYPRRNSSGAFLVTYQIVDSE